MDGMVGGEKDKRRSSPYVWVTWLTKLLAGENRCVWASWYKSHFKYDKVAETPDRADFLKEWTEKHDSMVEKRVATIKAERPDSVLRVEDDAQFTLKGRTATLSGKPDVVELRADEPLVTVYDQKSGKPRESDHWQVLIYKLALPLTWLKTGARIQGFVEYRDGLTPVRELTPRDKEKINGLMGTLGGDVPPPRTPSARECGFCDVLNCPDRVSAAPTGRTEAF